MHRVLPQRLPSTKSAVLTKWRWGPLRWEDSHRSCCHTVAHVIGAATSVSRIALCASLVHQGSNQMVVGVATP